VHQLSVDATSPTTWTHLVVTANESTMDVRRNATVAGTEDLSTGGATIPNASNWDGEIEESRTSDEQVNDSVVQTLYQTPTAPTAATETSRVMYDFWDTGPAPSTVPVYWSDGSLTATNASVVDGFEGQTTTKGTDWTRDWRTVTAVDGGTLDGAPVVFSKARYITGDGEYAARFASIAGDIATFVGVLVLIIAVSWFAMLRD